MFLLLTVLQVLAVAMVRSQGDDNKIIGGYTCIQNSQPWQVALLAGPGRRFLCGGALLSDQWVITAAHCARPTLHVALGKHNLRSWEATQQVVRVVRQVPHPQYQPQAHNNDVMLLKLQKRVRLGRAVRPITLASSCASPGTACRVSGWGTTASPIAKYPTALQCVNINIMSEQVCRQAYSGAITPGMVCAGVPEGGKDSCQVRLRVTPEDPWCVEGSSRASCPGDGTLCHAGLPGVYVNLCNYRSWVQRTMQSN